MYIIIYICMYNKDIYIYKDVYIYIDVYFFKDIVFKRYIYIDINICIYHNI